MNDIEQEFKYLEEWGLRDALDRAQKYKTPDGKILFPIPKSDEEYKQRLIDYGCKASDRSS